MQLPTILLLLTASVVSAQGGPELPCTTVVTRPPTCDCDAPLATITTRVDCHGCNAIETTTFPNFHCDIVCPTPRPIGTKILTIEECSVTPTPIVPRSTDAAGAECTSTTTVRATCDNCQEAEFTATRSVDCHGCNALAVETTGPVCLIKCAEPKPTHTGSTTTVLACQATPY